jgi:threonine aldolase
MSTDVKSAMRQLGMPTPSPEQWVTKLSQSKYLSSSIDSYSYGELVEQLEHRVANLLGKPSALFFAKGVSAQLCALRVAADERNNRSVILHPKSHLAIDEQNSYQQLVGLNGVLLGEPEAPFTFDQIKSVRQSVGVLTIELPIRRAGFKLTPWEELKKINRWCKEHKVHFHMDGARLWESTPFYGKSLNEISALCDSVYVSLYKGLGGMGGAVLAGETEFIEQCKVWRTRFGSDFYTLFPFLVSALEGLDNQLSGIPGQVIRAKEIASQLSQFPQLDVATPDTNGFFVFTEGSKNSINQKANAVSQSMGIQLFKEFVQTSHSSKLFCEIQVGAEHARISNNEILEYFSRVLQEPVPM